MPRYIDANELMRLIPSEEVVARMAVANAPTTDMVEIITNELTKKISERIIKFLEENYEISPKKPAVRCRECVRHNSCSFEQYQDLDGFFCSLGERRN